MTVRREHEGNLPDASTRAHGVLIVDDEDSARDLMARWLESGEYSGPLRTPG